MMNDQLQQQPRSMMKQEQKQVNRLNNQPPSPVSDSDQLWFDGFLNQEDANTQMSSNTTTATGSPLEFSSLFDVEQQQQEQLQQDQPSEPQSLFSSTVTSMNNSPMIKSEDFNTQELPALELSQSLTRNTSTSSMSSTANEDVKKPKKKRAPRKRLTAHQKQAHNKIEKRYRININAKIAGLQQIIPWVASEKTAFETGDGEKPAEEVTDVPRLNKSMILEKATSYILYLKENEQKMKNDMDALRKEVVRLGGNPDTL